MDDELIPIFVEELRSEGITATTTVLGLLPLLMARGIGSEVQRPLAVVVVFGLTTSTLLSLFCLATGFNRRSHPSVRRLLRGI